MRSCNSLMFYQLLNYRTGNETIKQQSYREKPIKEEEEITILPTIAASSYSNAAVRCVSYFLS